MNEELYNKLHEAGFYTKSFPEFQAKYGSPEGQQSLYKVLNSNGYYTKDFNSFQGKYFGEAPQEERSFLGAIPVVGEAIHYGGKNVENVVENMIPEQFATLRLSGNSAKEKELLQYRAMMQANPDDFSENQIAGIENELKAVQERLPRLEQEIQTQKSEAATKLKGSVQNLTDVNNVSSFMNWLGSSVGQAGGQIPLAAVTGGASSFLMEAAAVYDQQLDLLAEKHGISREEVVKRGLDKPAEGDAYAALAGAMDAISAGKIMGMFKNIAKQGAKNLAKKEVKESLFKTAAKDGVLEFFTEGTQGQLEAAGGAAGAGTEFKFNQKQFFNEGAAGFAGGAGIGMAMPEAKPKHPANPVIEDYEKTINNISTGDPELDQSLNELQDQTTEEINKIFDQVKVVEGTKTQEEIDKLREEQRKTKLENEDLKRQALIHQLYSQFEESPTVTPTHPASEENELGPQIDEVSIRKAYDIAPQPAKFDISPRTVDIHNDMDEKIGEKEVHDYRYTDELGGYSQGTIYKNVGSINSIYSVPDNVRYTEEEKQFKNRGFYQKVINELKNQGVTELRVPLQSQDSQAALKRLVEKGVLTNPRDIAGSSGNEHPTRFDIVENKPQINPNDSQNKERVQGQVRERQEPVSRQPEQSASSKEVGPSRMVQTPQAVEKTPHTKEQLKQEKQNEKAEKEKALLLKAEEEKENLRQKLIIRLNNAVKRQPSRRIAAIEAIAEMADKMGVEDIRDKAAKMADKEIEVQNREAEDKETRKKQRTPKRTAAEHKEFLAKEKEEAKRAREERLAKKKTSQTAKDSEVTIEKAKQTFLEEINYLRNTGDASYKAVAEKYLKFRKKNSLKEMTLERALASADAAAYHEATKKRLSKEREDRRLVKHRLESMKKEGKSTEEINKVKNDLEESLRRDLEKRLGVKLDQISGINLHKIFESAIPGALGEKSDFRKYREVSIDELVKRINSSPTIFSNTIQKLLQAVEQATEKVGKKLIVAEYESVNEAGVYAQGEKNVLLLLTSGALNFNSTKTSSTLLHEVMHAYTNVLASAGYNLDKQFASHINKLYDTSKVTLVNELNKTVHDLISDREPKQESYRIFSAALNYIEEFSNKNVVKEHLNELEHLTPDKVKAYVEKMMGSIYGFSSQQEFLAEGTSSIHFASLLNQLPYSSTLSKINSQKQSALRELFDAVKKFIKKHILRGGSAFEELDYILNHFDELYLNNPEAPLNKNTAPEFVVPTLNDLRFKHPNLSIEQLRAKQHEFRLKYLLSNTQYKPSKAPTNTNDKIVGNVAKTLERRTEVKSLNDVREYLKGVNSRLEGSRKLGDAYADIIWKKIEALRRNRAIHKVRYNNALRAAKANPKYVSSWKYRTDVNDFESVYFDQVPVSKLTELNQGIDALSRDGLVSQEAYDTMINYGKKLVKLDALVKIAGKMDQNLGFLVKEAANPASFASILGRYNPAVSTAILKHVYGGTMEAFAHVNNEAHQFFKQLTTLADKYNLTHSNLAKIGMYGSIFSTRTSPKNIEEWQKEVKENALANLAAAENKLKAKESNNYKGDLKLNAIKNEIEIASNLLKSINKSTKMEGLLSKEEQLIYDKIRQFSSEHERDFERSSIGTWGNTDYEHRFNYFPTMAQGKVSGVMKGDKDPLIKDNKDNLFEALGLEDYKNDTNNLYGKKVWSQYRRMNPKGYFYETDALAIAQRWSNKMLFDMYATTEMKALNRLLRDPRLTKAVNAKTRDAFKYQLQSIAGVGSRVNNDSSEFIKHILKIRDSLYTATLATTGQIISQSSSGFAAAAIISANGGIKAPQLMAKAIKATFQSSWSDTAKLQTFLRENGLGIQLRDILFEKYLTPEDYKTYLSKKKGNIMNMAQNATEWGLRAGDKLGARVVWFAAYFNAGGTLENPSKEAALEAERWVGMMQNMSDLNFAAPGFKYDTQWKKLVMGMFYAFKSFSVNSYVNLLYSTRYSLNSREARTVMVGQLASILAYHTAAVMLVRPIYQGIASALGGDDDDKDKDKKKDKFKEIVAESLWDTGALTPLFGMAAPSFSDALFRWVFANAIAPKLFTDPYGDYDKYMDNPLFSMKNAEDAYKQAFGPGYREFMETSIAVAQIVVMEKEADKFFETLDEAEKRNMKEDELYAKMAGNLIATLSWLPLRGDIKRVMEGILRQRKAQYLKDKKNGKGTGDFSAEPGEEGNQQEAPEFIEKDYELNEQ